MVSYKAVTRPLPALREEPLVDFYREYGLNELLPFDCTTKRREVTLSTELEEYHMLITVSLEAIKSFDEDDLIKFDSFVGENACQVRAMWIALIASKKPNYSQAYNRLVEIELGIQVLIQSTSADVLNTKWGALNDLLEDHNLLLFVNFELYLIIQLFLLTAVRIPSSHSEFIPALHSPVKSDPKTLKRFGDTSSMFLGKLVRKYRKFIADASVQFVREQVGKLGNNHLIKMLSSQFTIKYNDHLTCSPMFWTYQSILSIALKEGIPLIIHAKFLKQESAGYRVVDEDWLFFQPESGNLKIPHFAQRDIKESDYNKAAVVIQGFVVLNQDASLSKPQWKMNMLKHSVVTAILAGAADHPQYPHSDQAAEQSLLLQDLEYDGYKSFAKTAGFTLDNPTTFFIRHVYASKVSKFLKI